MREMKDSGITWVGSIPDDWRVLKNKYLMHKTKEICLDYQGEDILSLSMNGVIVRDLENPSGKMPATFDGYQRITPGNLLMCLFDIDVTPRCVGRVFNSGLTSPAYSFFELYDHAKQGYYYYYYLSLDNTKELLHLAKNLRHTLTEDQFGAIEAPVPPIAEQEAISDFLDKKCKQIEDLVLIQQRQIEKLKQFKQSLISELVTKGITSEPTFKDSGVDWIGKIPTSWSIFRLKHVCSIRDGLVDPKDSKYKEYPHIGPGNIEKYTGELGDYNLVGDEQLISGKYLFFERDLVYGKINPQLGKIAYPRFIGLCSADAYAISSNERYVIPEYLQLWFLSRPFIDRTILESLRMGMPKINRDDLLNIEIALPSISEQQQIVSYYQNISKQLSRLIKIKEKKLHKLDEYKNSLIYEYVTGKKEID